MRSRDFVEDRHAAEIGAALEKHPHQVREPLLRADGIAQRGPGAPVDGVHHEGGACVVEEQRLVFQKRQVGRRQRLGGDRLLRVEEVRLRRGRRRVRGIPNQPRKPDQQQHDRHADRRTQEPRGVTLQLELPPEIARILHVLEREQPEPDGRADRTEHGGHPGHRKPGLEERGTPVEGRPRAPQHRQHEQQQRGLFVVDALEHRRRDADDQQD